MTNQAVIVYVPHDERGKKILDDLEERTDRAGRPSDYAPDAREYWVAGAGADVHAFEPMLDKVDPDRRDHLSSPSQ